MTTSEGVQVKRKQSSLAKASIDNASTSSLPTSLTKRPRSDSVDSRTSSWFQRLYPSNSSATNLTNVHAPSNDNNNGTMTESQSDSNQGKQTHNTTTTTIAPTTTAAAGNGDDDDSGSDSGSMNKNGQQPSSGIWSWFGYSNASTEGKLQDVPSSKEDKQSIDAEEVKQEPVPVKSASWRSFFWTTSDQRDSVVIEKNGAEGEATSSPSSSSSPSPPSPKTKSQSRPIKKNMVLPSVHPTSTEEKQLQQNDDSASSSSIVNKALRAINAMFSQYPSSSSSSHSRVNPRFAKFVQAMQSHPEDIAGKKFVIIGVHGWFPTKLVRSVIGEPTGTSIKFCEQMVAGMRHYFKDTHGLTIPHHAITSIPLEGEGKVAERVDMLYQNLVSNPAWVNALASADIIFWATHSQGTPVSAILLHQLLEQGMIHQPVCFLAMAGISHGPFPSLKGNMIVKYFEADAARELFEFMDSSSTVSQRYRESLAYLLRHGVKTVLIGSMQDQVVPLYSAIMAGASHPNILRAMYIDGHVYSEDDFLINLILFALRLRNAGLSDHGLLTHLSEVLAGDLYSWEGGHSTVYEEVGVFTIAVQYMFESRDHENANAKKNIKKDDDTVLLDPFEAKLRLNPFYLPWAMRGICDDAKVLGDAIFSRELEKLRTLFERWKPSSSKLREVKFRLEPLKARL